MPAVKRRDQDDCPLVVERGWLSGTSVDPPHACKTIGCFAPIPPCHRLHGAFISTYYQ